MLIYSDIATPRLQYICKFIFAELLHTSYSLTNHADSFHKHDGPKLNYSKTVFEDGSLQIVPHGLLFEKEIQSQSISCFAYRDKTAFFKSGPDYAFDIFAASFYLLSRYEEYLPHSKDIYGRFAHENSLAYKENFLSAPLINIWVHDFAKQLQQRFAAFKFSLGEFSFLPSYDIDMAWSYRQKGWLRNIGGFLKKPSLSRIGALAGLTEDPFDSYGWMDELHISNKLQPVYFFLMAEKNGLYDKNILPSNAKMQLLIKKISGKYPTGLHPSWASFENPELIRKENKLLENISGKKITQSRQHYIKMDIPETYRHLYNAGITDDYSMGYGSINGFRASVASFFYWYDLLNEKATPLRLHPFCFMDANSYYEQKQSLQQTANELAQYCRECKNVNGQLITIFHNNFLGNDPHFRGWKEMYADFITRVRQ